MRRFKGFTLILFFCFFYALTYAAWDKTKPADNDIRKQAPSQIRANWEAIETGTDAALLVTNAKVSPTAGIVDTKLATISTAGKVSGAALTSLASVPSGAGVIPTANIPSIDGAKLTGLANIPSGAGVIPAANLPSSITLAMVYPVGSIYISTISTNPATLFGFGTWTAYAEGRVLVGKASSGTFQTAGATMGEETHALTAAENGLHTHGSGTLTGGAHTHSIERQYGDSPNGTSDKYQSTVSVFPNTTYYNNPAWGDDPKTSIVRAKSGGAVSVTGSTASSGNGDAHNNIQPSIVVYMWQRTA